MNLVQTSDVKPYRRWSQAATPAAGVAGVGRFAALLLLVATCGWASSDTTPDCVCGNGNPEKVEAIRLGEWVMAAGAAISDPAIPGAMDAITRLGHDSRYYTMTRGWLVQVLQGNQSVLDAGEAGSRPALEARQEFLRRALRAIDLD